MDQAARSYRSAKHVLKDVLQAAADTAHELTHLLQADSKRSPADEFTPRPELADLTNQCQAAWPVAITSPAEILKATALLLVLQRFAVRLSLENGPEFPQPTDASDGLARLFDLAKAAEALADIDQALQAFDHRLPAELPELLNAAAEDADALLPLSLVYEQLLAKFDRRERSARGVFHTPAAVAHWLVRATDHLVSAHFPTATNLRLIDMGCGCGTFLAAAMRRWQSNQLACTSIKPAFVGYEVVPTSLAVAHWLLDAEHSPQRQSTLQLRWTNPLLAGNVERPHILASGSLPILLGNPPYANFGRANRGPWIDSLLRDYKSGLAERKSNLNDDFIRFIRWGQHWIDEAGEGILAVVTSRTYLTGITHRQMRRSLLASFDQVYVLDLHGDSAAEPIGAAADEKASPSEDENVFDVRSGVAIGLFVKTGRDSAAASAPRYHALLGPRSHKLSWLRSTDFREVPWRETNSQPPMFHLAPVAPSHSSKHAQLYESFWPVTRIFRQWVSGVQTKNDALFVDFDRNALAQRIEAWLRDFEPPAGEERPAFDERRIQPYLLAPFDRRWIYYDRRLLGRPRYEVMRHMLQPNIGLVFMRQSTGGGEYDHFLAVDCPVSDRVFYSRHGAPYLAPLWLYESESDGPSKTANFTAEWLTAVAARIEQTPTAEAVFDYLYAVAYQTRYRRDFTAQLRRDFPRFPLPASATQFEAFASLGSQLRQLHTTLQCPVTADETPTEPTQRIGGYDVLKRWRKPRSRRPLTPDEAAYEEQIRQVLQATARLRAEIDRLPA